MSQTTFLTEDDVRALLAEVAAELSGVKAIAPALVLDALSHRIGDLAVRSEGIELNADARGPIDLGSDFPRSRESLAGREAIRGRALGLVHLLEHDPIGGNIMHVAEEIVREMRHQDEISAAASVAP